MTDKIKTPEQLMLPFSSEDTLGFSAQVFFMRNHRSRADTECTKDASIPKIEEKKILDRVLERAERLRWYK